MFKSVKMFLGSILATQSYICLQTVYVCGCKNCFIGKFKEINLQVAHRWN